MITVFLTITSIGAMAGVFYIGFQSGYNKAWREVKKDIMDGKVPWK
jgi:hypothetical protein